MGELHEDFIETLVQKRQEVEHFLLRLKKNQEECNGLQLEDNGRDESDQAQREISASSNYGLIERKTRELRQIDALIKKVIQDEQVGFCEECGDRIPFERLLVVPEATLCVPCQRELESFKRMRPIRNKSNRGLEILRDNEMMDEEDLGYLEYDLMASGIHLIPTTDTDEIDAKTL
jgi:DnaK suppressor protein